MRNFKLKSIINNTWIVSILCTLVLQTLCIVVVMNQINDERTAKINEYVVTTKNIVNDNIKTISKIQKSLINNINTQKTLVSEGDNYFYLLDDILKLREFASENFHVVLFDSAKKNVFSTRDLSEDMYDYVKEFYGKYESGGANLYFCKPKNSVLSEIYIISFQPVIIANTSKVSLDSIGTSTIIHRISTLEISNILTNDANLEIHLYNPDYEEIYITKSYPNNKRPVVKTVEIENTQWSLIGKYVYQSTDSAMLSLRWLLVAEPILLLIILLLLQFIYKFYIEKSIKEISGFLNNYVILKKGTFIKEQKTVEFNEIVTHINNMVAKTENLSREIVQNQRNLYERELEKKSTLLYALQTQINPHFLYNTMDCIKSIAFVKNVPEIVDISVSFSYIIRYSLKETKNVTVENELELLKKYMNIINIRQPNRISLTLDAEDQVMDKKALKMMLQPLLENAIKYNTSKSKLAIKVKIYFDQSNLVFEILDNGVGIEKEKCQQLRESLTMPANIIVDSEHIGLRNINYRIKLLYGDDFGVSLDSIEGEFTKVIIKLPIL